MANLLASFPAFFAQAYGACSYGSGTYDSGAANCGQLAKTGFPIVGVASLAIGFILLALALVLHRSGKKAS